MVSLATVWRTGACLRRARGMAGVGLLSCALSPLALACGGIVEDHRAASSGAPALGTGGTVSYVFYASGGSAGDVAMGGAAGHPVIGTAGGTTTGGATGEGGATASEDAGVCRETNDSARIEVMQTLGDGGASLGPGRVDESLTGVIQSVDRSSFTVLRCDLDVCGGVTWTVTIDAPQLDLRGTLTGGNRVRVHFVHVPLDRAQGQLLETWNILVTNPDLAPNPGAATIESLYVAANAGGGVMGEAPYYVSYVSTSCPPSGDCYNVAPGASYHRAVTMSVPMGSAGLLGAAMGQTAMLLGPNGRLTLRNLHSFDVDWCNGAMVVDVSYWITNQPYRE